MVSPGTRGAWASVTGPSRAPTVKAPANMTASRSRNPRSRAAGLAISTSLHSVAGKLRASPQAPGRRRLPSALCHRRASATVPPADRDCGDCVDWPASKGRQEIPLGGLSITPRGFLGHTPVGLRVVITNVLFPRLRRSEASCMAGIKGSNICGVPSNRRLDNTRRLPARRLADVRPKRGASSW